MPSALKSFTYGAQFEADVYDLKEIIDLCSQYEPDRVALEAAISQFQAAKGLYPTVGNDNRAKLAMNTFLSLRSYRLIEEATDRNTYTVTSVAKRIREIAATQSPQEAIKAFAIHILRDLDGMKLLKAIENIEARDETVALELIAEELGEMGLRVAPNAVKMSIMRAWLAKADVFRRSGFEINWDTVYELLGVSKDELDELYQLESTQKYYLLSLISLDVRDFTPSNKVANHTRSVYKIRLTTKNLKKDVLESLAAKGLVELYKPTEGRGAKPWLVKLTPKVVDEVVEPLLRKLAEDTDIPIAELYRSFEDIVADLPSQDKHVAGKALELLAIWMIRLTSLRFTKWRKQDEETGQGEVDVLAASDRLVYSRWQIQCKNMPHKPIDVDVIAKEVGMTFVTGADVIMVVTTGRFTSSAVAYAYRMMDVSRYYVILLEYEDIQEIARDRTAIIKILDRKARRVFIKKELRQTDDEVERVLQEIDEEELMEEIADFGSDQLSLLENSDVIPE